MFYCEISSTLEQHSLLSPADLWSHPGLGAGEIQNVIHYFCLCNRNYYHQTQKQANLVAGTKIDSALSLLTVCPTVLYLQLSLLPQ